MRMKRSWFTHFISYLKCSLPPSATTVRSDEGGVDEKNVAGKKDLDGWKCMPYIIGNETFEKVASMGLTANFTLYLVNNYRMNQITATQVTNIYNGTTNFAPLLGAFVSDAYWGRFKTYAYGSVASFLGMVALTMTATIPSFQPPSCSPADQKKGTCPGASKTSLALLVASLALLTIGAGGVRPCGLPFGVDQFDRTTEKGRRGLNSFFNWYYGTSTAGTVVALTVMVYLQDSVSWGLGLGIPTALMFVALILFFLGTRLYEYVPPDGSVFSGIVQVIVAAFKKRKLQLPAPDGALLQDSMLYNPRMRSSRIKKLPLTMQFRWLNKAAIKREGEVKEDGSIAKPWRLCTVQQIEEVKCLARIVPIWASGMICLLSLAQQWTFAVLQSLTMDRHMGPHFQIPAATMGAISLLAIVFFVPIYDLAFVPLARKYTGLESGITLLQRQGIGMVISTLSMVVAGLVEQKRRISAVAHGGITPLSAFWIAPQLILTGIGEAFNAVGQIEFYNKQFPEHMQTLAGSLFPCTIAASSYLSAFLVSIFQKKTDWLDNNINQGRLDYFYYVIAAMGTGNFIYFLICAHFYRYKGVAQEEELAGEEMREEVVDHRSV